MSLSRYGPDLVLAGTARSGTSSFAARLGEHPGIDPGSVKESNYFSRHYERGGDWYDGLYRDRKAGLLRLDASTSYTSPEYPRALDRLAADAPEATVVYVVRQPTQRAISHYLLRHHFFRHDRSSDFGAALAATDLYVQFSDYARWLVDLHRCFPVDQIVVLPFEVVTSAPHSAAEVLYRLVGLPTVPAADDAERVHRNPVVQYRSESVRKAAARLRRSALYPRLRGAVGADRMRRARSLVTRGAPLPTPEQALASCDARQRERLHRLEESAGAAVLEHLVEQDRRLGLDWAQLSFAAATTWA